ncbi:hypothetical protein HWV62_6261, partial [Athelia sp. TMB]
MVAFYNPDAHGGIQRVARKADVSDLSARYPFKVKLPGSMYVKAMLMEYKATRHQGGIEAIFLDALKDIGHVVDRQTVPVSMHLSKDEAELRDSSTYPVQMVLQHLNDEAARETVHAKFVVGTDGAHSWVRKSLGIAMEGIQTEYIWGVLDLIPETDFPDVRNRCVIHSNNGSCMIIPREGDGIRLYVQLSDTDVIDPTTGRVDPKKMGPNELLERVASQFSASERIFIAGDACHTHSPKAGQGMNASMSDSHNLGTSLFLCIMQKADDICFNAAWKLAQVLRGTAHMSLLQTYELERRKFAQDLISFDRKFSALFSSKPRSKDNDDGVSHEEFFEAVKTFGAFTSGIGIHYPDSVIVNSKHQVIAKNVTIGQRMPPQVLLRAADGRPIELQDLLPSDTRFKILVFAGDTTESSQRAKLERLAEELGNPKSFLSLFSYSGKWESTFDIITISSGKIEGVEYTDVPELFRSHWSKIFVDDQDMLGRQGGRAYENLGISSAGAVVAVRPDGYVGLVFPFDAVRDADEYFASFMCAGRRGRTGAVGET